jgi:hypothetical protein
VVFDLVEGELDLPAFPVERYQLGGRVLLGVQQRRAQVGDLVALDEGDDPVDHVLGQRSALSRGSEPDVLSRSRHRQVRAVWKFFLDGPKVVGLEPDQQIRTRRSEGVSELDRPEAAVGNDQVAGAGGAGHRVGEAALAVAIAAEAGIQDSMRSDLRKEPPP